jgi:vacuolar-type H+-ATPase subunit H
LAKEKSETLPPPTASHSAVESIVGALAELETDIDGLYSRVDEMKKRIMAHSNEQVENLKQQVIALANEEAQKIVDAAKAEADAESEKIAEQGRASLASIKKNINSSFDSAVDSIVRTVLGDASAAAKTETAKAAPAKPKKYNSDGKPVA